MSIDIKGKLHCYRQTNVDQMIFHHESTLMKKYYPKGLFAGIHCASHDLIIVSGSFQGGVHSKSQVTISFFGLNFMYFGKRSPVCTELRIVSLSLELQIRF